MNEGASSFVNPSRLRLLLLVDGWINLLLGTLLVVFPEVLVEAVGVPSAQTRFYPSILGGVLVGIGIALLVERARRPAGAVGLGPGGAIAINLCGAAVLAGWLVLGDLPLAARGTWFLWVLVVVLVGVSAAELHHCRGSDWAR